MVTIGETYYQKLTTTTNISGYTANWSLFLANNCSVLLEGNCAKDGNSFIVEIPTDTLDCGEYSVVCLCTYPDGFVDNILKDRIILERC